MNKDVQPPKPKQSLAKGCLSYVFYVVGVGFAILALINDRSPNPEPDDVETIPQTQPATQSASQPAHNP